MKTSPLLPQKGVIGMKLSAVSPFASSARRRLRLRELQVREMEAAKQLVVSEIYKAGVREGQRRALAAAQ